MQYSCRKVIDGLSITFLLFIVVGAVRGGMQGSAVLPSVVISIFCVLCAVGIYRGIYRVRTITAYFFLFAAVGAALVAMRINLPVLFAASMSGALAITGVFLLAFNKTKTKRHMGSKPETD
jgi:hypothetical protein